MEIKLSYIIGGAGAVYGLYSLVQNHRIAKKLGTTVESLADKTRVDMSAEATQLVAEKAISKAAEIAASKVSNDIFSQVKSQVNTAVTNERAKIASKVESAIVDSVAQIDEASVRKEVERRATDKFVEKCDKLAEEIVEGFKTDLFRGRDIYRRVADSIVIGL